MAIHINKDFFIHSCNIERATNTRDTSGQVLKTWTNVYTALPCYLKLNTANEVIISDKYSNIATYRLYLAKGYTVYNADIVSFGSLKYEVINVNNQIAEHLEIDVIRVS